MKNITHITTLAAVTVMTLALAACSSDENTDTAGQTDDAVPAAAEQQDMMQDAQEGANAVAEKAAEVAEALKLDTSSLENFQSSLGAMRASLSPDQATQLRDALGYLTKSSAKEQKGGLLDAAKSVATGKSMEDILYENMADQLDGLTFEDILKLAG